MPTTGEKPGKGQYKCKKCGKVITLDNEKDKLPSCPVCNHTEWDKLD